MLIYPPSYAWGYDFCFHTIPRCLMSPTKHALYMHTHCWPGRLKSKSNSKPHRLLMRNFHISIIVLVFLKDVGEWFISRRQSVYTHTHIIKYHIWHVPHTHHIYAKTIDTLTKCFSHFLFGVAKEHSEEENARLSESDGVNFRQKTSKAFPALCGWAQIFFSSLLPIPWYCLFLEFKA